MTSYLKIQRICKRCSKEFTARTTTTLYCSKQCGIAASKTKRRNEKIEIINKETQQIKKQSIEELKAKAFLSIADTCKLIGISRRTVYRMIERGELITGKAGRRTIIRRSDLEQLIFEQPETITTQPESTPEPVQFDIADCYNLTEVQTKYGIAERTLHDIIKRNSIPKIKKGWFAYVPKITIDKLLS